MAPGRGKPVHVIVTCEPNETVGAIHPKAMPVMLDRNSFNRCMDDDHLSACELAVTYAGEKVMVPA
jgi:putative SOS response-associated peptidase YedK